MNSKELIEQADQRIAEVEAIRLAKRNIEDLERLIKISQDDTYDVRYCGELDLPLEQSLDVDNYNEIRKILKATFQGYLSVQIVKLEQLLGITPKIVNPSFEAAVRGMVESHPKPEKPDMKQELTEILKKEANRIEKTPASSSRKGYPAGMTDEAVSKLVAEGKANKEIAVIFDVPVKKVESFKYTHKIGKQPVETEGA